MTTIINQSIKQSIGIQEWPYEHPVGACIPTIYTFNIAYTKREMNMTGKKHIVQTLVI